MIFNKTEANPKDEMCGLVRLCCEFPQNIYAKEESRVSPHVCRIKSTVKRAF